MFSKFDCRNYEPWGGVLKIYSAIAAGQKIRTSVHWCRPHCLGIVETVSKYWDSLSVFDFTMIIHVLKKNLEKIDDRLSSWMSRNFKFDVFIKYIVMYCAKLLAGADFKMKFWHSCNTARNLELDWFMLWGRRDPIHAHWRVLLARWRHLRAAYPGRRGAKRGRTCRRAHTRNS